MRAWTRARSVSFYLWLCVDSHFVLVFSHCFGPCPYKLGLIYTLVEWNCSNIFSSLSWRVFRSHACRLFFWNEICLLCVYVARLHIAAFSLLQVITVETHTLYCVQYRKQQERIIYKICDDYNDATLYMTKVNRLAILSMHNVCLCVCVFCVFFVLLLYVLSFSCVFYQFSRVFHRQKASLSNWWRHPPHVHTYYQLKFWKHTENKNLNHTIQLMLLK